MSASKEYKPTHGGYPGSVEVTPKQVLMGTLAYLSDPMRWTQKALYRRGMHPVEDPSEATCACLIGAIGIVAKQDVAISQNARNYLRRFTPDDSLIMFNDSPTTAHADVLALLNKAISA